MLLNDTFKISLFCVQNTQNFQFGVNTGIRISKMHQRSIYFFAFALIEMFRDTISIPETFHQNIVHHVWIEDQDNLLLAVVKGLWFYPADETKHLLRTDRPRFLIIPSHHLLLPLLQRHYPGYNVIYMFGENWAGVATDASSRVHSIKCLNL